MAEQLDLAGMGQVPPRWPDGFALAPEQVTAAEEVVLIEQLRGLPLQDFEFRGYVGHRRTASFGWAYDFNAERLVPAEPIPGFLAPLAERAADFAAVPVATLEQVLVSEYQRGAGIGWHRDKAVFGLVVGISLGTTCRFRMRRQVGAKWERVAVEAPPRSAYHLRGPARQEWEHSIPPVETTRYSVTFRTRR